MRLRHAGFLAQEAPANVPALAAPIDPQATVAQSTVAQGSDSGSDAQKWTVSVTPYLWLPNINGNINYNVPNGGGTGQIGVSVGPNSYLAKLNFAFMGSLRACAKATSRCSATLST